MKHLVITLILGLLTSCNSDAVETGIQNHVQQQRLVVFVYDISVSVDKTAVLGIAHFEKLYVLLGASGGGKVYGVHIRSNSRNQEPLAASVESLDLMEVDGNIYQRANQRRKNERLQAQFAEGKQKFVDALSPLIVPKKESFSDLKNALDLALEIVEMDLYTGWNKHLIIVSDMENDLPPRHGIDHMAPVTFPDGVTIGIVRPSRQIDLNRIFSAGRFSVYSTIDDAIQSLENKRR